MAITKQQFNTLENLFDYYNQSLFANTLPACLISLARHKGAAGLFARERWQDGNKNVVHEISLNPDAIKRSDEYWHSTLVHEMVHLWEMINGTASRQAYHNKIWAAKMESIGLMPSHTGAPGGNKTGQRMSDYVIKGGAFDIAFKNIALKSRASLKLPYTPNIDTLSISDNKKNKSRSGLKIKYTCLCKNSVWGKPDLRIQCQTCGHKFKAVQ